MDQNLFHIDERELFSSVENGVPLQSKTKKEVLFLLKEVTSVQK